MEVKGILRRAQSLRSVSTDHGLIWTEAGLRDKRKSVSQLVAHYQKSPGGKTKTVHSDNVKHEPTLQVTSIPISDADGTLDNPVRRSRILSRSKSMESLPQRRPAGTTALRELFESKVSTQPRSKISKVAHESVGAEKEPASSNSKHVENMTSQTDAEVKNSHNEQDDMNKEERVTVKGGSTYPVVSRSERRKTVSGVYTEKRSFPEEDKRRSVVDFRDSSSVSGQEISAISVKALSALYLSKVAAAEPVGQLFKPEQDPTSPTGKRLKPVKMAEGPQDSSKHHATENVNNVAPEFSPSTDHLEPRTEEFDQHLTSPPPTREAMSSMHQRRQKCELRRLLKHTCPELKNIDGLVEEELADILNTDPDPDTGYQCEVQSKRWLFENHAVSPVDFHPIKRDFQDCDIKKTPCLSEKPMCISLNEENKPHSQTEIEEVTSEQNIRVDVKATRRMFEIQSMDTSKDRQSPCPKRNVVSEEQSRLEQKPKNDPETFNFGAKTADIHSNNHPSDANIKDTNDIFVAISRAKQVFENRSHDENISITSDSFSKEEEMLKASVRNRAQMFESTPLDKINQQTKEETETILENMQYTLNSLLKFNIIQADGSILEANENGHVEKARYVFIKDSRPEVHDEEIVTGSIKNIMLQMLPGTNLNPIVTFLKEDSQGNVEIHKIYVPTHQLPFTILQDKDYKIANVVQITEDLLGQEKSLRKGVLIQNGVTGTREVTVYALFGHNEESIRLVEFDKTECRSIFSDQTKGSEKEEPGIDINTKAMWDSSSEIDLEASRTINVQLVRSCIEKGDLDYLKHVQKTASDEDTSCSTGESEKTSEIIPGNVKNIKVLFSTNLDESLQSAESKESKMLSKESGIKNKNNKIEGPMHEKAERCSEMGNNLKIERILPDQDIEDEGAVLQAELVDVVEDDEVLDLQTAIMNLHQATMEAKALQESVQAKHQPASQPNQTQQIRDPGSASHEIMEISCTSSSGWDNSFPIDLEANTTINVQLVRSCIEKGDLDHLKHLQKTASDEDISCSTGESEKASEIIPGNVKSKKALFSTNLDESLQSAESKESKMLSKESGIQNINNKTEGPLQAKTERCSEMGNNLKVERILPNQDIKDEGAVLQAELVDVVEDELLNLQTAIMNLHQATMEAKALQQSVQAKQQPASQPNQTQQIRDPGSACHELMEIKKDIKISVNDEASQITKPEQDEGNEDVMRGSIQAALESLGKSNFNVTKGDFRAAMIYRNSGKGNAGHKKVADQPSETTGVENKTELSAPELHGVHQVFQAPSVGVDTTQCQRPSENKLLRNQIHVSTDTSKKLKTPIGPKPAIPPKPDHLKLKPTPNAGAVKSLQGEGQVIATSSKPSNEENKEPSPCFKSCANPISYKDALCKNLQQNVDAYECKPNDTSISFKGNDGSTQAKLNPTQVVEESPKCFPESKQSMNESSTEFHTTLQNSGVKPSGSVAPVKPKRIKMAKDHVKNSIENTHNNSAVQQDEIPAWHDRSSPQDGSTLCGTYKAENNNKCDNQQNSEVVKKDKNIKGETEDERRQRLSVHMDEIMKENITTVMEIFDKLKKQEELKNILSKVEEIQEDSSEVDERSLRNESMPDWVVPQDTKINHNMVLPEHREGASDMPVEPEMLSSMQMAFGDLEKAGAEIISLKEQTLAKLIDIEEAIKKALYSVSTLKSDADIVGLSGLFRESMVAVQSSPTSGNIRTISIGSSKSPKAQNQNRQLPTPAQNSKPELFIPTTKQRSSSPASPSFISIQSAARKCEESPSQISTSEAEPKEEAKPQCCYNVSSDHSQCTNTNEASSSPANRRQQVSISEVQTAPEGVIDMRTISENYEKKNCLGNQFYSSKTSTVVPTHPESRTTSEALTSSPTTSEIVTNPRINTPLFRQDRPPL